MLYPILSMQEASVAHVDNLFFLCTFASFSMYITQTCPVWYIHYLQLLYTASLYSSLRTPRKCHIEWFSHTLRSLVSSHSCIIGRNEWSSLHMWTGRSFPSNHNYRKCVSCACYPPSLAQSSLSNYSTQFCLTDGAVSQAHANSQRKTEIRIKKQYKIVHCSSGNVCTVYLCPLVPSARQLVWHCNRYVGN